MVGNRSLLKDAVDGVFVFGGLTLDLIVSIKREWSGVVLATWIVFQYLYGPKSEVLIGLSLFGWIAAAFLLTMVGLFGILLLSAAQDMRDTTVDLD